MKNKCNCYLVLIIYSLFSISINAQILNDITKPSLSKNSLSEKVYLQIDNALYQTGETIWFKAIVSKSYNNSLSDISKILHVELIDFNETIIDKKLLKLNDGITNGSFILEDSYKAGKYLIRAYTKWNRNFEEDFIYSQSIDVINIKEEVESKNPIINIEVENRDFKTLKADINPKVLDYKFKGKLKLYVDTGIKIDSIELSRDKNNIYKLDYKLPENTTQAELKFNYISFHSKYRKDKTDVYRKTVIIDKDYLDVQFFPEGGKLVNGLVSTVAFKAINYEGLGHRVSGDIKDDNGKIITSFNSNKLGMGTFKLIPERNKRYYAEINIDDIVYEYDLPIARPQGSVMSLVKLKDDIKLLIASNSKISDNFIVETQARGVKYHRLSFKYKDTIKASIPSLSLPDGIIKVSLFNDKKQVICERLFFNNRSDNRIDIGLTTNKLSYSQRDKVNLKVKIDSLQNLNQTSLSVLVLDKERTDASKNFKSHILSYLLLSSELKGFVENPSYYFDKKNKSRIIDLETLMLTQGWRDYKYKKIAAASTYSFKPEKSIEISGTIGQYFNPKKKPKNPLDLNLMIKSEPLQVYSQEIQSNGKYHFQLEDINKAKADFFMQVVNRQGEPIDFKINVDKKWLPEIKMQARKSLKIPQYLKTDFTERMEVVNETQKKYETTYNTIALDEVNIKDYKLTPAREKFIELHGEPTKVIDGKELNEDPPDWNFGLFSVLRAQFPDKVEIINMRLGKNIFLYSKIRGTDFTYILVDNIPVALRDYSFLETLPVEEVTGIDILESPRNKNKYCSEVLKAHKCPAYVGIINIYTKSRKGIYGMVKTKGFRIGEIQGFFETLEFYSPNYEIISSQDWVVPDNRSVIHWEPNITPNANGEFILEFYNDDHIGEVSVIVEAISKDGKIGYTEKTYLVKEAER